ncbi:hypothetical protein Trydic_g656 [Trypoxylus dichotomus]
MEFQRDENIILFLADKGNATVILNTRDYKHKMQKLLEDPTYKPITTDPTTYLEKTTRIKINNTPLSEKTKKLIMPSEKSSKCPKMYGLSKIYKQSLPLRHIVSSIGSPAQALAPYLANQLKPYGEEIIPYIKNANYFIDILRQQYMESADVLVSFDVT